MGFFTRQEDMQVTFIYSYVSKHTYNTRLRPRTLLNPE